MFEKSPIIMDDAPTWRIPCELFLFRCPVQARQRWQRLLLLRSIFHHFYGCCNLSHLSNKTNLILKLTSKRLLEIKKDANSFIRGSSLVAWKIKNFVFYRQLKTEAGCQRETFSTFDRLHRRLAHTCTTWSWDFQSFAWIVDVRGIPANNKHW